MKVSHLRDRLMIRNRRGKQPDGSVDDDTSPCHRGRPRRNLVHNLRDVESLIKRSAGYRCFVIISLCCKNTTCATLTDRGSGGGAPAGGLGARWRSRAAAARETEEVVRSRGSRVCTQAAESSAAAAAEMWAAFAASLAATSGCRVPEKQRVLRVGALTNSVFSRVRRREHKVSMRTARGSTLVLRVTVSESRRGCAVDDHAAAMAAASSQPLLDTPAPQHVSSSAVCAAVAPACTSAADGASAETAARGTAAGSSARSAQARRK